MVPGDWSHLESVGLPLLLNRNLTIRGRARPNAGGVTELDLGFSKAKVYLPAYVVLKFEMLTLSNWVSGTQFLVPTPDLVAPNTRLGAGGGGTAMGAVMFTDVVILMPECFIQFFEALDPALIGPARPPTFPGLNVMEWIRSQDGCVNTSTAPPLERCWQQRMFLTDVAAYATTPGPLGAPMLAGFIYRGQNSWLLCADLSDNLCDGCIDKASNAPALMPTPRPSSPPAISPAAGTPAGDAGSTDWGPLLGGILGGIAVVAVAVVVFMLYRRRRRRLAKDREDLPSSAQTDTGVVTVSVCPEPTPAAAAHAAAKPKSHVTGGNRDMLVPVTALTPMAQDVRLDVHLGQEVQLTNHVLGKGAYGRVVRGVYMGVDVAVKLVDYGLLPRLPQTQQPSAEPPSSGTPPSTTTESTRTPEQLALLTEVEVLARCQHPNVIKLLAANVNPKQLCLVMELMDTSLDRVFHSRDLLPLPLVLHIASEVAQALAYLHPTIIHRDLKPANILLSNIGSERPLVKLADFGISRLIQTVLCTDNPEVGTVPYMAPELFDLTNHVVTDRVDVYALAILMWQLLSGQRPWADTQGIVAVAYAVGVDGKRPPLVGEGIQRCPPKLINLIKDMWEHEAARRPAAAEVVKMLALCKEQLDRGGLDKDDAVAKEAATAVGLDPLRSEAERTNAGTEPFMSCS